MNDCKIFNDDDFAGNEIIRKLKIWSLVFISGDAKTRINYPEKKKK